MHHLAEEARDKAGVITFAAGFYALFTLVALAIHGWNPLWFAWEGERFAALVPGGTQGYDGQFVLNRVTQRGWSHSDPPYTKYPVGPGGTR